MPYIVIKICNIVAALQLLRLCETDNPDSKVHGANMGPIWGQQDPGGPHVGPMNFAIWEVNQSWLVLLVPSLCC